MLSSLHCCDDFAIELMQARQWMREQAVGFNERASRWATLHLPTHVLGAAGYNPAWLSSSALCPWHTPQQSQDELYTLVLDEAARAGAKS